MEPINVGIKTIQDEKCLDDNAKVMFLVIKKEKNNISRMEPVHTARWLIICTSLKKDIGNNSCP